MQQGEAAQQVGQEGGGVVVRAAHGQRAGQAGASEVRQGLVVVVQDAPRMHQQAFAVAGQAHAAPRAVQQRLAAGLLQALHLHAQGGLGAAHARGGRAQRAGLGHGGEAAQQVDVKGGGHGINAVDFSL